MQNDVVLGLTIAFAPLGVVAIILLYEAVERIANFWRRRP